MGYFDLQLNGYAGLDFNGDTLDAATLQGVCDRLEQQGVDGVLATIVTDFIPVMEGRLSRLAALLDENGSLRRVIKGIHVEGPFINPCDGYRGCHPADAIVPADPAAADRLLAAGGGWVRLVTLAPECDPGQRVTRMLADRGVVVAAGHTDASLEELQAGIDSGLSMFTHLGNGCPSTMPRHDNIVQRALSLRSKLWLTFIADGTHIPFFALANYLELVGLERSIVVTDGIVASDLGPGRYQFGRWDIQIGDDLVARSPGATHFIGSTTTMPRSFHNLTAHLGYSPEDANILLSENPRRALGMTS